VKCYNPENRFERKETDRFKAFTYDELINRDKANLGIFWLKDDRLTEMENLPEPDVIASEIVENLEFAFKIVPQNSGFWVPLAELECGEGYRFYI